MAKHDELRRALRAELDGLPAHSALATERDLSERHGVSRATVRRALAALEDDGLVYRIQGAGTFTSTAVVSKSLALTSFSEDMRARDLTPSSRLLGVDVVAAGHEVAPLLGIDATEDVLRVSRLRLADGAPMCLETVHLRAARVPGLAEEDLTGSLYDLLAARHGITVHVADQVLCAVALEPATAALLAAPTGHPALQVRRLGLDRRELPIEATTTVYRADRYDVRFTVRRGPS